jgi:PIN domain nuclease of toxin-antitoxin system
VTDVVLDASAVIAVLKREKGHEKVLAALRTAKVSAVNIAEAGSHFTNAGYSMAQVSSMLDGLALQIASFDRDQAMEAARLRPLTRVLGLSLSDRACLALARQLRLPAMTTDRAWTKLQVGVQVIAIR